MSSIVHLSHLFRVRLLQTKTLHGGNLINVILHNYLLQLKLGNRHIQARTIQYFRFSVLE